MNARSGWWKAIGGLAVTTALVAAFLLFRGEQQGPPVVEATATTTPEPTGTPPPRRLGQPVQVPVPAGFLDLMDLEGDTAVGRINVDGENQIVLIDVVTGKARQISSATGTQAKYSARISDHWVVWCEYAVLADHSLDERLKVYDREGEREYALEGATAGEVDLSGDVVVWQEWRGRESVNLYDLYAYNLRTGQAWTIAERPGAQWFARVSGAWVIYVDSEGYAKDEQVADLRARNLGSGEDVVLGQIDHPLYVPPGDLHAISAGRVVWVLPPTEPDYSYRIVGVDLDGSRDPQPITTPGHPVSDLQLFNDVLIYHEGRGKALFDLQRGELLAIVEPPLGSVATTIRVSGDRVVWATSADNMNVARIEH